MFDCSAVKLLLENHAEECCSYSTTLLEKITILVTQSNTSGTYAYQNASTPTLPLLLTVWYQCLPNNWR